MSSTTHDHRILRVGMAGALLAFIGTLVSGPITFLAVSILQPQPAWGGADLFVAHYHPLQSVTYYFGFLLLTGSVLIITAIYLLQDDVYTLLALVFTAIAAGLVGFNYFSQASFIPALVRSYTPEIEPILTMFAVTNPASLFWAIEMWGYGFLGLGTWFAAGFFLRTGVENVTRLLFVINGVVSVVGAFYTGLQLEWVLTTAGLISYALWNVLYIALAALVFVVFRRRSRVGAAAFAA